MKGKIIELLYKYTRHNYISLTSRGNKAIMTALTCAKVINPGNNKLRKTKVIIPDQGGWLTYETYPKKLGFELVRVKTDLGLLDLDELKTLVDSGDVCCILYQNPAGYFANQNIEEIYSICKGNALVILDVSGSIGDSKLCNGDYADLTVGSFGKGKPVDAEYGGFVSIKDQDHYNLCEDILKSIEFDENYHEIVLERLKAVPDRLKNLYNIVARVKNDLKHLKVVHPDKSGVNVVILYDSEPEKKEIINYCEKHKYEFTNCPRYIRIMRNAISIEIKRNKV